MSVQILLSGSIYTKVYIYIYTKVYTYIYMHVHTCLNTKFQKREGKLWTYTYTNNTKAQIDYIFINKKWNNSVLNCKSYSSFEDVSSDHQIVTGKVRQSLRRNMARTTATVHYDWVLLNNRDIRDKYALTLRNKFDAL